MGARDPTTGHLRRWDRSPNGKAGDVFETTMLKGSYANGENATDQQNKSKPVIHRLLHREKKMF